MRIIKRSERENPTVSLVLLDWSVRESLHLLHYLKYQNVPRDSFEVIVIEYYDHVSPAVAKFESEIDTWVLLQMPANCYYHKHLMYNAGIVFSLGDILMFGDSDAMVRPTFIERIVKSFEQDPLLVYHMDEFRNVRRDLYPFNYPSFEEVLGEGCINNIGGKTKGLIDTADPMHTRNYGACMCARRDDVISIGGADEDLTYLGHICGPYDMTFRLMNSGRRMFWDPDEYLYHTWHPGTDGTDNYLGPHDGMNMSTTAFQALCSGRIHPLVENRAIRELRLQPRQERIPPNELFAALIDPAYLKAFSRGKLGAAARKEPSTGRDVNSVFASYKGVDVYQVGGRFYGVPESLGPIDPTTMDWDSNESAIAANTFAELRTELDGVEARLVESGSQVNICAVGQRYAVVPHALGSVDFRIRKQRENPSILWSDTLADARQRAEAFNGKRGNPNPVEPSPVARRESTFYDPALADTALSWQVAQMSERLRRVEVDVSNIYRSRIWRTLVRVGGAINAVIGSPSR